MDSDAKVKYVIPRGYKKTELGIIPEDWEIKSLGEIGKCLRGVSYNGSEDLREFDTKNTIRLLRSNNIQKGKIVTTNIQFVNMHKVKPYQKMQSGDILICMANGSKYLVGKAGFFNINDNHLYTFGAFMETV